MGVVVVEGHRGNGRDGGNEGLVRRQVDICLLKIPLAGGAVVGGVGALESCGRAEALLPSVFPAVHERAPWPGRAHWTSRPRGEYRGCMKEGDTSVERGRYSNGISPPLLPRVSLGMQVRKERWEKWGHR